jgi:2-polyprenyl-3-methyl-5-hydroxy-6-metoxy-1,4-benzoquinol methylase
MLKTLWQRLLRRLPASLWHRCAQAYRAALFRPNPRCPQRGLDYADAANIPQEMQFAIDCLPLLSELLQAYPRQQSVRLLDFGPGFGAGGNLFAQLFRSDFLACPLRVEALDVKPLRAPLARFDYPLVNYRVGELAQLDPTESWDIIYCSNVIEHLDDPRELIEALRRRAKDWLILYAPLAEQPLSAGHLISLSEAFFQPFQPVRMERKRSLAWNASADHRQLLVLLKGAA